MFVLLRNGMMMLGLCMIGVVFQTVAADRNTPQEYPTKDYPFIEDPGTVLNAVADSCIWSELTMACPRQTTICVHDAYCEMDGHVTDVSDKIWNVLSRCDGQQICTKMTQKDTLPCPRTVDKCDLTTVKVMYTCSTDASGSLCTEPVNNTAFPSIRTTGIIVGCLSGVTFLIMIAVVVVILYRRRCKRAPNGNPSIYSPYESRRTSTVPLTPSGPPPAPFHIFTTPAYPPPPYSTPPPYPGPPTAPAAPQFNPHLKPISPSQPVAQSPLAIVAHNQQASATPQRAGPQQNRALQQVTAPQQRSAGPQRMIPAQQQKAGNGVASVQVRPLEAAATSSSATQGGRKLSTSTAASEPVYDYVYSHLPNPPPPPPNNR